LQSFRNVRRFALTIWNQPHEAVIVIISKIAEYFILLQAEISSCRDLAGKKTPRKLMPIFFPQPLAKCLLRLSWPQLQTWPHSASKQIVTSSPKIDLLNNSSLQNPSERMAQLVMNNGLIQLKLLVVHVAKHMFFA